MERRLKGFIWIGLGISLFLALFLSPFASSSPDGLEKVAESKGFAEKGEGWKLWKYAPFSHYAIPWIKNEKVSTAISGLIGTLAIFLIAFGIGKIIKKPNTPKLLLLILPSFFLFSTSAFALRPLTTDDAYTVEKGTFQLEAGMAFETLIFSPPNHSGRLSTHLIILGFSSYSKQRYPASKKTLDQRYQI